MSGITVEFQTKKPESKDGGFRKAARKAPKFGDVFTKWRGLREVKSTINTFRETVTSHGVENISEKDELKLLKKIEIMHELQIDFIDGDLDGYRPIDAITRFMQELNFNILRGRGEKTVSVRELKNILNKKLNGKIRTEFPETAAFLQKVFTALPKLRNQFIQDIYMSHIFYGTCDSKTISNIISTIRSGIRDYASTDNTIKIIKDQGFKSGIKTGGVKKFFEKSRAEKAARRARPAKTRAPRAASSTAVDAKAVKTGEAAKPGEGRWTRILRFLRIK